MNQHLTVISQLDQSDLTDRMVRVAIALLNRANDRGELHITRADACAICQVEGADTVAKYLARLAAAARSGRADPKERPARTALVLAGQIPTLF